jgi:NAD(P)-dependent dehydrogenase (short-subunit alcohol dehydrogenase family)
MMCVDSKSSLQER